LALQQPEAQLVASQTQAPPEQRWPAAQAAPPPQEQPPVAVQRSAVVPQERQVPASAPHWALVVGETQTLPAQQPVGQLEELQTQLPPTHSWPGAQALLPPHLQTPVAQVSVVAVVQLTQELPLVPQVAVAEPMQMPF
jgi:hypothetical protein